MAGVTDKYVTLELQSSYQYPARVHTCLTLLVAGRSSFAVVYKTKSHTVVFKLRSIDAAEE